MLSSPPTCVSAYLRLRNKNDLDGPELYVWDCICRKVTRVVIAPALAYKLACPVPCAIGLHVVSSNALYRHGCGRYCLPSNDGVCVYWCDTRITITLGSEMKGEDQFAEIGDRLSRLELLMEELIKISK